MEWFMKLLKKYEIEFDLRLINTKEDYNIMDDKKIPKPFKKNQVINAKVMSVGKYRGEFICLAEERSITVKGDLKINNLIKVKIVRDKHNIFRGVTI